MSSTTTTDAAYSAATSNPQAQYNYAKEHCTLTPYLDFVEPYSSGWTYKHILELTAGIGTVLCLISITALIFTHLTVWVRPAEQKQIVRILLFAPVFAIFNFFGLWFYDISWILTPFAELYECFALVAVFYLMVLYVSPDEGKRETFFHHLQRLGRFSQQPKHNRGSLQWFQITWVLVFQILPAKLAINVAIWGLNAAMCPIAYVDSKASTAVSVVQSLVTVVCVMTIIGFHRRLRKEMDGHHALAKLWTFKGFVGIVLLQTPIFAGLAEHHVFHPTQYVSYVDFIIGTPSFLVCLEMFIVSLLFLWSFSAAEYKNVARAQNLSRDGVGKAVVDVINISDILKGCWYMCRIIFCGGMGRALDSPSGPTKNVDGCGSNVDLRPMEPTSPPQYSQQQYPQQQYPQQQHSQQQYQPQQYQQQPYQQQQ